MLLALYCTYFDSRVGQLLRPLVDDDVCLPLAAGGINSAPASAGLFSLSGQHHITLPAVHLLRPSIFPYSFGAFPND